MYPIRGPARDRLRDRAGTKLGTLCKIQFLTGRTRKDMLYLHDLSEVARSHRESSRGPDASLLLAWTLTRLKLAELLWAGRWQMGWVNKHV